MHHRLMTGRSSGQALKGRAARSNEMEVGPGASKAKRYAPNCVTTRDSGNPRPGFGYIRARNKPGNRLNQLYNVYGYVW